MRKTPPPCFAHLRVTGVEDCVALGFGTRLMIFAPLKFFTFCREAKFGGFRPTLPAHVVCGSSVRGWQWG
jgi:hypothetical protein